jgi:hypothetical protein
MNKRQNNENKPDYSWIVGVVIAIAVIFLSIAIAGNDWNPSTGDRVAPQGCTSGDASGAGC